jgi:hypothetical protein
MEDLFNRGGIIVSEETLTYKSKLHPIKTIINVSDSMKPDISKIVLNIIMIIIGVPLFYIFPGNLLGAILIMIVLGYGISNLYEIFKRKHYRIIVELSNGEKLDFDFPNIATAIELKDALNQAMITVKDELEINNS